MYWMEKESITSEQPVSKEINRSSFFEKKSQIHFLTFFEFVLLYTYTLYGYI